MRELIISLVVVMNLNNMKASLKIHYHVFQTDEISLLFCYHVFLRTVIASRMRLWCAKVLCSTLDMNRLFR